MGNVIQKDHITGCLQNNYETGSEYFRISFTVGSDEISIHIPPIVDINESVVSDIQLRLEHGDTFKDDTVDIIVQKTHGTEDILMRIVNGCLIIEMSNESSYVKININKHRKLVMTLLDYIQGNHEMEIEYNTLFIDAQYL